jgi:hypothetical protein
VKLSIADVNRIREAVCPFPHTPSLYNDGLSWGTNWRLHYTKSQSKNFYFKQTEASPLHVTCSNCGNIWSILSYRYSYRYSSVGRMFLCHAKGFNFVCKFITMARNGLSAVACGVTKWRNTLPQGELKSSSDQRLWRRLTVGMTPASSDVALLPYIVLRDCRKETRYVPCIPWNSSVRFKVLLFAARMGHVIAVTVATANFIQ